MEISKLLVNTLYLETFMIIKYSSFRLLILQILLHHSKRHVIIDDFALLRVILPIPPCFKTRMSLHFENALSVHSINIMFQSDSVYGFSSR